MPNTFVTPEHFAPEALRLLENELVLGNKVHTDYSKEFTKKGETIQVRRPTSYMGQDDNLDVSSYREDIIQGSVPLTMDKTVTIKVDVGAIDKTLSFDRMSEDVIKPAVIKMRDRIESELAKTYSSLYWFSGTPGTALSTFRELASGGAILTDAAVPMSDRFAVHGTDATVALADELKGVYVQGKAKTAFEQAQIGRYAAFDNFESVHTPTHLVGDYGGTGRVNGANQDVTYLASKDTFTQTLVTDGWSTTTTNLLRAGDVFTMPGVFAVNPISKMSTGRLQTFTVTEAADSDGSGNATLTISPAIIATGAYQTVTAAPADNAIITIESGAANSQHSQSLLLHPKAMALVSRPLEIAQGAGVKTTTKTGNRVTISCTEWVNPNDLSHNMRFDMLFGVKMLDPRLGGRITN